MAREGITDRRNAVLVLVLLVHSLFVALALRPEQRIHVRLDPVSPLVFLNLAVPIPPQNAVPPPKASPKATSSLPPPPNRADGTLGGALTSLDSQAGPASDSYPLGLGIDWYQEAAQVADFQAQSLFKELKHLCDEAALRGEVPAGCRKYRRPDAWVPEPKKFGIAGGLPYVRLGKRCVLGLGFFGCGVGKLPEANGQVLDDRREPDRPRSSVPDPNE